MALDWRSGLGWDEPEADGVDGDGPRAPAPGKVTLTSRIQPRVQRRAAAPAPPVAHGYLTQPVQRRASGGGPAEDPFALHLLGQDATPGTGADAAAVHAAAAHGVAGPAEALPHRDRIQASFGHHDVSGIRAHVGGPAAEASAAMGARAFATGSHVAFAGAPDLHTAAHEAAHVIQQAGGVQLAGGVGAEGDRHERHADRVADTVVAGESAEALLDEVAAGGPPAKTGAAGGRPAMTGAAAGAAGALAQGHGAVGVVQRRGAGSAARPGTAASALGEAARQVSEEAMAAQVALGKAALPDAALVRLDQALDALGDALHQHSGSRSPADERAVTAALRDARGVATALGRRHGPHAQREVTLRRRLAAIDRLATGPESETRGAADMTPAELAAQAGLSLTQLEDARDLGATLALQIPRLDAAIDRTDEWRATLSAPDATADDARRLSRAVLGQQALLFELSTELADVVASPSPSMAEVLAAYLEAMARSVEPRAVAERYAATARRARRAQPLAHAAGSLDAADAETLVLAELEPDGGGAGRREYAALERRQRTLSRRLAAGGKVSDLELRTLQVDARESAVTNHARRLEAQCRQLAKALGELGDTLINRFDQDLIDYRAELLRIAARFPSLRDRYQRQVAQSNDEHGASFDGPWQILRARERALDELEHRIQVTVARGALVELLHRASNKAESAQTRAFAQQLLTTIAITLAGNIAASAVRGAAEGAVLARAAKLGKDARVAATMARAQQVGAAAGFAADVSVSTIGQKLQGDGASLLTLLALNVVSPLAVGKVQAIFPHLAKVNATASRLQRAGRWALDVAYDKLDLSVQMIVGAAVDHASRILMGAASLDPSEQKAEEWLAQGAAMAVGRHLATRNRTIARRLSRLQASLRRSSHELIGRAKGLEAEAMTLSGKGDPALADRLLRDYDQLLADHAAATMGELPPSTDERMAQHGLDAVVPDRVYEGTPEQVGRAVKRLRQGDQPVEAQPQPDGSYRYKLTGPDGATIELIARPKPARGSGGRDGAGGRGGGGRDGGGRDGGGGGGGGGGGRGGDGDGGGLAPRPRRRDQVQADVERAALKAANMAGGVKVEEGGVLRLPDGDRGFPVKLETRDLGAGEAVAVALHADHAVIAVSLRARPEQVERALANGLTKATALTERRRAGKPLEVPDALGKGATGEFLSPTDLGKIAELRVMRRQHAEAQAEGPAGAARVARLGEQIQAFERQLAISDDSPGAQHRRRMVETQVVVQNDRARRERARAELNGERGHAGVELHSHFMGVVDTEVFRQKAAVAAHGEDTGSWVPVLEQLASFHQFEHERGPDKAITKRSAAGDAYDLVVQAAKRSRLLTIERNNAGSDEARQAIQERIEMLAEDAVRAALTATRQTDFNSAYELRDELVKATFAGARPRPTGEGLTDKAARAAHEDRGFDEYTREAIRRLARDRVGYAEQSNSLNKMAKRFGAERVRRIVDELVAAGELRPGEVDLRFLTMIPTHHFGERLDGNPEESHAPRELEPTPQPDGTARSGFEVKLDQMLEQIGARGDTVGIDIASLERYHFDEKGREAFKTMYVRLVTVARQRGQQVVLRPHVGEGSVDNAPGRPFDRDADRKRTPGGELTHQARARHNVEQLLVALEQLRAAGELDPAVVVVRFGHATVATPDHVRRMHALGVIAEVNLASNVRTGAADQTVRGEDGETSPVEQYDDHALPTMLYYDAQVVLSTDAHDVMQTTLRQEYDRGHRVIEEILAGERGVRVRAADAGERGKPVGDATDDRWLSIEDMTAAERDRFQRGYEKLHADAQAYYRHRPRPEATAARNPRGAASPQGGAHWTDTARAHGLRAIHGQRRFAGTRADVERAVAAYRTEGATALPISTHPDDIVYRVTSPDGRAELELEGWGPRHDADHLPIADLDRALATNAGVRDWYNGEVARIGAQNAAWKAAGVPLEARARRAYEIRHQARLKARQMMRRRDEVDRVEARDQVKYGDLDGPTFDQLLAESMGQGLTREQALERILGSSTQTSEEYNRRSRAQGGKP